jgi:hypothetical protein
MGYNMPSLPHEELSLLETTYLLITDFGEIKRSVLEREKQSS